MALARGRTRTANTGTAACYIRPVKLRPLLPSPRGRCPASVPALLGAAASIEGSPAYFPQLEDLEEKGSCPLLPVCNSSALHGVKGPRHQPLGESPLGTEREAAPSTSLPCWGLALEESPGRVQRAAGSLTHQP